MSASGATAQDSSWKAREQSEEARYIHEKEQAQLAALRDQLDKKSNESSNISSETTSASARDKNFEGGFGGQEDLEDRYATTSGEH